ncbi:cobalt-zinc-cadmium efflux system membrane fusion protein [Variovorax sp. GrIS 2.14]|uniref:efflux RND transporter periplasmic adaptor subunit n=1 Tax=Variovorax sp. GrIS 2.14 TaxID=3071709 RepID=UPI0038F7AD02
MKISRRSAHSGWRTLTVLLLVLAAGIGIGTKVARHAAAVAVAPSAAPGATVAAAASPPVAGAGLLRYARDAPELASIRITPVEAVPLPALPPANAHLAYDEDVTARVSSPVAGRVVRLMVQAGDRVRRGAALAELDSPDLASAQSDLAKAKADEAHKRQSVERTRALAETETGSRKDNEAAEADLQQAVAETRRAAQRMNNLATATATATVSGSGRFVLRAPIDGVVVDRQINAGMEVRPDLANPLFVITDTAKLWALADVSETALNAVHAGQPVELEVDAWPGQRFAGVVRHVGAALDAASRRLQVRCEIANADGRLRAEMFSRVAFLSDTEATAIRVPNGSLVLNGMQNFVIVEQEPGVFARRPVQLRWSGSDTSYLSAGLHAGERIVSEGALLLASEFPAHAE